MGRAYIVDDAVEEYLSKLCEQQTYPVIGLLIGQSSPQRDYVIMATRTPSKEELTSTYANSADKEWVTEHARQVSRMLPGGLCILGVFIITDSDAKDTVTTLRQLVFAIEKLISSEYLWLPADDDVTDCVTLHVNPKTRITVCRTFDINDPKSTARPAEWKYQSGVCSSWSTVSCCFDVDLLLPLPYSRARMETIDTCLKEGLKVWANQIQRGVCLIDRKKLPEDMELTTGQKRNVSQTYTAQLLITPEDQNITDMVQKCDGSVSLRGGIHSRTYLHNNRPMARIAERLLKRDVVSTVAARVRMLLEELAISEGESRGSGRDKQQTEELSVPRRVFCSVGMSGPVSICDYQFNDEEDCDVTDRLKEMLDIIITKDNLDTMQETLTEIREREILAEITVNAPEPKKNNFFGVAMATAVALLATSAMMFYLNDN